MTQPPRNAPVPPYVYQTASPQAGQPVSAPAPRSRMAFWTRGPGIILITIVVGLLLVGVAALTLRGKPVENTHGFDATVIGCTFDNSGGSTIANVDYTVKNNNRDSRRATLRIEFRDEGGHVVDDDFSETRLIGAGDSVHGSEMTFLDVAIKTGTCEITRVS